MIISSLNSLLSFASLTSINKPLSFTFTDQNLIRTTWRVWWAQFDAVIYPELVIIQQQNHSLIQGERMLKPIHYSNKLNYPISWGRALISMSFLRFYISSSIVLITIYHICCYFMLVVTSFPLVIDGTLKGRVGNVEASYLWKHKIPPFLKITLQNHTSSKTHERVQADQCLTGNVMKDGKAALSDYLVSFTGEKTL